MNPKTYTAPHRVYIGGKMYEPGEPFVTDEPKGDKWETVTKAEKAAIDASSKTPGDPPLEGLSKAALEAVAVERRVDPTGLTKNQLIDAIKAANDPQL